MNFSIIYWRLIALMLGDMGISIGAAEPTIAETGVPRITVYTNE